MIKYLISLADDLQKHLITNRVITCMGVKKKKPGGPIARGGRLLADSQSRGLVYTSDHSSEGDPQVGGGQRSLLGAQHCAGSGEGTHPPPSMEPAAEGSTGQQLGTLEQSGGSG